jgi:hypothetical protein
MPTWNGPKAKSLCTAAEWKLVQAASLREIARETPSQLRRNAAQARRLFDKWRQLAKSQARSAQKSRGSRVAVGNARSAEKAGLFAMVTERFDEALAKATGPAPTQPRRKPTPTRPVAKKASGRTASAKAVPKTRVAHASKSSAKKVASPKSTAGAVSKKAPRTTAVKAKAQAKKAPATPKNEARETRTAALAKQKRFSVSGPQTRIQAHVQARGRRSQARRDSRN